LNILISYFNFRNTHLIQENYSLYKIQIKMISLKIGTVIWRERMFEKGGVECRCPDSVIGFSFGQACARAGPKAGRAGPGRAAPFKSTEKFIQ
jgi:hypothetical protein